MIRPVDIAHHVREDVLEVTWEEGPKTRLSGELLRRWCPCAGCQGHEPGLREVAAAPGVRIASLHEVGAYALGVCFSDGHESGIYTWPHLRRIAELAFRS